MGVSFLRGQQLGRKDLNIFLTNASGHPTNAAEISYSLYDFTTGMEALLGQSRRTPANPSVGEYYASLLIPLDANIGSYRIRWTMREVVGGPLQTVVQEFDVRDRETSSPTDHSDLVERLVVSLRRMIRDNDPDRNYRFRPPTHEGTVDQYSRVFGYIWEDDELVEYMERALDMISAAPPRTPFASLEDMVRQRKDWTTLLLSGASYWAFQALQANWVADEFSLAGDTLVDVKLPDGVIIQVTLKDLYDACK
jgi:hypothetical protein